MLNINYDSLLNDDFIYSLTNNLLYQNFKQKLKKINNKFFVIEFNTNIIVNAYNSKNLITILNCIYIFNKTRIDPLIFFEYKNGGLINDNNFDMSIYNVISVSILANENKILKEKLSYYENNFINSNKKRRLN